jgi:hypothetical protein
MDFIEVGMIEAGMIEAGMIEAGRNDSLEFTVQVSRKRRQAQSRFSCFIRITFLSWGEQDYIEAVASH